MAMSHDDEVTGEIIALANELVGRVWFQFQARVWEFNLSAPEAKATPAPGA